MASGFPSVTAVQVGSYFVGQYYQVFKQQPDLVHQFYSDSSTMIRIEGDSSERASNILEIHTLIKSLNFILIEIKTINSLDSWNGGVLVMISGSVKIKDITGRRKFMQTFFLAPQEKGYYVLNDIFQFVDDGETGQNHVAVSSESALDAQVNATASIAEQAGTSDYALEEEARDYVNSIHLQDDSVEHYRLSDQVQQEQVPEVDNFVDQYPEEPIAASVSTVVKTVYEPHITPVDEPLEEPPRKSYASILQVPKRQSAVSQQPMKSASTPSEVNHVTHVTVQQPSFTSAYVPESIDETGEDGSGVEDEGEMRSVYVRNLPATVTEAEIEEAFKHFGQIKPDGIFIKLRNEMGLCYAFVEFEDMVGVQNALQASPIQLGGRQIYIEERRPNPGSSARGGRGGGRGRGRGSYQTNSPRGRFGGRGGRGGNLESGEYSRQRGNGYSQRGAW